MMTLDRLYNARMTQNYHLVWLDASMGEVTSGGYHNSIIQFQQIINSVNTFNDVDECVDFITDFEEEKAFMIISGEFNQMITAVVQEIVQIDSIFIVGENTVPYENWVQKWSKVKGVHSTITSIYEALKQIVQDYDQNSVSISFIQTTDNVSKVNLDQLDQSFMYTQILKDILLTIDFQQEHIEDFLTYCREVFVDKPSELRNVEKFAKEYRDRTPIWWYTYQCFLFSMVNRALRTMEVDLIIKLGFFIRDLHKHIAALHIEQYRRQPHSASFVIYRGQGLSQRDFDELKATQGGLLAFNNFLSTSHKRDVSLRFARRTIATSDLMGVVFVMQIDPSISTTPFANIKQVSCYQKEEEILFSMHSVFRIGEVKRIEENDRLWQVDLTLTDDNDPQLHLLTQRMQEETEELTEWDRLGQLMIRLGQFRKAEELYEILCKQATTEHARGRLYHMLGLTKCLKGEYTEAIAFYEKSLGILQKILPAHDLSLAASYANSGLLYYNMGEYVKALSCYGKTLETFQKTLPANHPHLAALYNNMGSVYDKMSEYSKALSYFEKALEILQKTLPANHPNFATAYNNTGLVYKNMGKYSNALSCFDKTLEIRRKILPANHPDLATSYNDIGLVYDQMGDYSKALSYYEKANEIQQKALPANHPELATSYHNIGMMYAKVGEYAKALSYCEKVLEIEQKALPANHPSLATSYNNIGVVYSSIGQYSKALSYHEKALEIQRNALSANHPDFAISYDNIGRVYVNVGEYSKALSYFERALSIWQRSLPSNHLNIKALEKIIEEIKKNC